MDEREQRLEKMYNDKKFMGWLSKYDPDYDSEYSGVLLGMHAAYCAGREEK